MTLKKIKLFLLLGICFANIFCGILLLDYFNLILKRSDGQLKKTNGCIIYSIQHESNPLDKNIYNFQKLYHTLVENDEIRYYELYLQDLENTYHDSKFFSEVTGEMEPFCKAICCIQISANVIERCNLQVKEGRLFSEQDFFLEEQESIPVLMGSSYEKLYDIGDIFNFQYLYNAYKFEVIGFLDSNSKVDIYGNAINLDNYIIMPSFHVESISAASAGLKIHYANKTSGLVEIPDQNMDMFYSTILPLLSDAEVGDFSWNIYPEKYNFYDYFGIELENIRIFLVVFIVANVLLGLWGILKSATVFWDKGKEQLLKNILSVCSISFAVYCLHNVIFIYVLGYFGICFIHLPVIVLCCAAITGISLGVRSIGSLYVGKGKKIKMYKISNILLPMEKQKNQR